MRYIRREGLAALVPFPPRPLPISLVPRFSDSLALSLLRLPLLFSG